MNELDENIGAISLFFFILTNHCNTRMSSHLEENFPLFFFYFSSHLFKKYLSHRFSRKSSGFFMIFFLNLSHTKLKQIKILLHYSAFEHQSI